MSTSSPTGACRRERHSTSSDMMKGVGGGVAKLHAAYMCSQPYVQSVMILHGFSSRVQSSELAVI
jgi:hypothetical protein